MRSKGFTLIELIVVIAIISIIAVIGAMNFFGLKSAARQTRAESDLRVLKTAVDQYSINKMSYPSDLALVVSENILTVLPKDPYTADDNYHFLNSGNFYAAWSVGLNGTDGSVVISPTGIVNDTDDDDIGITNGACSNTYWK